MVNFECIGTFFSADFGLGDTLSLQWLLFWAKNAQTFCVVLLHVEMLSFKMATSVEIPLRDTEDEVREQFLDVAHTIVIYSLTHVAFASLSRL